MTGIGSTDTLQLSTTYGYMEFDTRSGEITTKTDQINKNIIWDDKIWYKNFLFECTHNSDHIYLMTIALEFRKGAFTIRKIGQYPSMLTVKGFDFDKYKQFLEEINAYEDYKKADLSFAEHFYVGAYAYLRRIFEKLINKYLCGTELSHENMETKIKATKERFDSRIRDSLTNLYGILSIGIHQLEEDESERYYIYLKAIIDIQLEYEKTEKDKDSQAKKYSSILGQIRSELGKR